VDKVGNAGMHPDSLHYLYPSCYKSDRLPTSTD